MNSQNHAPKRVRSAMAMFAFAALATTGCSLNDSGYKAGELGNGGFYFSCDDAAACSKYTDDASKFPKAVAQGATFTVRFVPKQDSGVQIKLNESEPNKGITIQPVGEFVSRGPKGLVALKTGYATLASRDAAGKLIDYVVVRVAKPDTLVVFSADESRTDPPRVETLSVNVGDRSAYRAFAQEKKQDLAGSLQIDWTSSDKTIFDVENTNDGKATIIAKAPGNAKLHVVGGTFEQDIPVEVKQ
jgi:hypothetical protein